MQASDLNEADAYDKSTKKVNDWIDRQNDDAVLPSGDFIVESFPDGPHEDLLDKVDIVVVTPESTPWRQNPYRSLTGRSTVLEVMHGDAGELGYIKGRCPSGLPFLGMHAHFPQHETKHPSVSNGSPLHLIVSRAPTL